MRVLTRMGPYHAANPGRVRMFSTNIRCKCNLTAVNHPTHLLLGFITVYERSNVAVIRLMQPSVMKCKHPEVLSEGMALNIDYIWKCSVKFICLSFCLEFMLFNCRSYHDYFDHLNTQVCRPGHNTGWPCRLICMHFRLLFFLHPHVLESFRLGYSGGG